ncbi:MAG: hypothetical protein WCZ99_01140 [Candidatus Paceibacterota bacterium]
MNRKIIKIALFLTFFLLPVFALAQCPNMTTVSGTSVTFVGELTDHGGDLNNTVWFEYGKTSSLGLTAPQKTLSSPGMYCITVSNLDSCSTYHYRAAASNSAGTSYGDIRTFNTSCGSSVVNLKANNSTGTITVPNNSSVNLTWNTENMDSCQASGAWSGTKSTSGSQSTGNLSLGTYTYVLNCSGQGGSNSSSVTVNVSNQSVSFTVDKFIRNLSTGTSFFKTVYAAPDEMLSFSISVKAGNQSVNNVNLKTTLSDKIIYRGDLKVNNVLVSGNVINGINIGNFTAGEEKIITFRGNVLGADIFSFGQTELINTTLVTSGETAVSDTAKVVVVKGLVAGIATDISTGLTNNLFLDSFLLPLLMALLIIWLLKSKIIKIEEWMDKRKRQYRTYKSKKTLQLKIAKIKVKELLGRINK